MLKVAIIVGSTRPQRVGRDVAEWVYKLAQKRGDAEYELVDIKDFNLPLFDEPASPAMVSEYRNEHTKVWSQKISPFDAFVFVTPEYNHGPSGALKNALDFLYREWNHKVAGFVGYGSAGGVRSVEVLRLVCAELKMATVRNQVALNLMTDFENFTKFKPQSFHEEKLSAVLDDIQEWAGAMKSLRIEGEEELSSSDFQDDSSIGEASLQ